MNGTNAKLDSDMPTVIDSENDHGFKEMTKLQEADREVQELREKVEARQFDNALAQFLTKEQSIANSGKSKQLSVNKTADMLARTREEKQLDKVGVDVTMAERLAMDKTEGRQQQSNLEEVVLIGQQQMSAELRLPGPGRSSSWAR